MYATTLNTFFPNAAYPAISSLDVSVDLKTAVKKVEGDRTWSFKDDATGVSLDVRADAGSSSIGSLDKASLRVRKIDDASTRAAVSALLSQRYVSVPDFALYDVQLIADGDPVALDGKTATHLSMPASSGSSLDSYANGMLTDLAGTIENGRISVAPGALGTFVLASSGDCEKRKWSRTLKDPATGVSMSYATDGTPETPLIASTPEESCQMLEWYSEYLSLPAVNKADEATQKSALALIKQEGSLANPELSGIYAAGMSMEALMGVPANLLGGGITLSDACNPTSMAIPMASPDSSVYLVTGTVESGLTKVKKLSATVDGGYGIVSLTQESTGMNAAAVPLFNAAANFDGTAQGPLSSSSEIGYLVVASAGSVSPEEPPSDTLSPGTYEVTANLAMPGQYNPAIKGLTVYANSPDNPFGPTIDENSDVTVKEAVPSVPMKANARIVVSKDGKKTLVLPVRNPIFTTQSLGTCATLSDIRTERVKPTAGGGSFSGTYGRMKDRIHDVGHSSRGCVFGHRHLRFQGQRPVRRPARSDACAFGGCIAAADGRLRQHEEGFGQHGCSRLRATGRESFRSRHRSRTNSRYAESRIRSLESGRRIESGRRPVFEGSRDVGQAFRRVRHACRRHVHGVREHLGR